jgi:hypothetical protein
MTIVFTDHTKATFTGKMKDCQRNLAYASDGEKTIATVDFSRVITTETVDSLRALFPK